MKNHLAAIALSFALTVTVSTNARPLMQQPSMIDVIHYMEPEGKTFACYCDIMPPYGRLDTTGCATPGERAVVGHIITPAMMQSWFPKDTTWNESVLGVVRAALRDPLNITLFSSGIYPAYSQVHTITGTMTTTGQYGACPFSIEDGMAKIADGRLGEIARVALYLRDQYALPMPDDVAEQFSAISAMSEPTEREVVRTKRAYRWNKSWNDYVVPRPKESEITREVQQGLLEFMIKYRIRGE